MGYPIGQSNIVRPLYFLMVLASDHITGATGKTPTVTLLKSGATGFTTPAGAVTEIGNGIYAVAANATDAATVGPLLLHATAAACDPRDDEFEVLLDLSAASVALSPSSSTVSSITARTLIGNALKLIGVLASGEAPDADQGADGLQVLNEMLDGWATERLTLPSVTRTLQTMTTAQSYTLGLGGTWNQAWPNRIEAAGIVVTLGSVVFEFPLTVVTDATEWAAIRVKAITTPWPRVLYYDHAYSAGLGTVNVWPKPDGTQSLQAALYTPSVFSQFASLNTAYAFPSGYPKALRYNLAMELAPMYGVSPDPIVVGLAQESKGNLKRANDRPKILQLDGSLPGLSQGAYDIRSGGYL